MSRWKQGYASKCVELDIEPISSIMNIPDIVPSTDGIPGILDFSSICIDCKHSNALSNGLSVDSSFSTVLFRECFLEDQGARFLAQVRKTWQTT